MSQRQQTLGGGGPGQLSFPGRACRHSECSSVREVCMEQEVVRLPWGGGDGWGDSSLEHLQAPTPKSDCLCQPGSSHILPPGLSGKPVVLSKEGAQLLLRPLCFQFSLPLIFPRKATLVNSLRAAFWENRFLSLLDHSPNVPDY